MKLYCKKYKIAIILISIFIFLELTVLVIMNTGWYPYHNTDYGFSNKFPSQYKEQVKDVLPAAVLRSSPVIYSSDLLGNMYFVSVSDYSNEANDEDRLSYARNEFTKQFGANNTTFESIVRDGRSGFRYYVKLNDINGYGQVFIKDKRIYQQMITCSFNCIFAMNEKFFDSLEFSPD